MTKGILKIRKRIIDDDNDKKIEQKIDGTRYVNIEVTIDDSLLKDLLKSDTFRTNFLNKFETIKNDIIDSVINSTSLENNIFTVQSDTYHNSTLVGIRELHDSGDNYVRTGIVGASKGDVKRDTYRNHKPVNNDENYNIDNQSNTEQFLIYNADDKIISNTGNLQRSNDDLERVITDINNFLPVENDRSSIYKYPKKLDFTKTKDGKNHVNINTKHLKETSSAQAFQICEKLILQATNLWAEKLIKSLHNLNKKSANDDEKEETLDMAEYLNALYDNKDDFKKSIMSKLLKNDGVRTAYEFMTKYIPIKLDNGKWVAGLPSKVAYDVIFNMFMENNAFKSIVQSSYESIDKKDKIRRSLMRQKESTGEFEIAIIHNLEKLSDDLKPIRISNNISRILDRVKNFADKHSDIMNYKTSTGKTDVFGNEKFKTDDVFGISMDIYNAILEELDKCSNKIVTLLQKRLKNKNPKDIEDLGNYLNISDFYLAAIDINNLSINLFNYINLIDLKKKSKNAINENLNKYKYFTDEIIYNQLDFSDENLSNILNEFDIKLQSEIQPTVDDFEAEDENEENSQDIDSEEVSQESESKEPTVDDFVDENDDTDVNTNTEVEQSVDADGDADENNA